MMDEEKAVFPGLDHAVLSGSQLAKADPAIVLARLQAALTVLRAGKPSDRSETARRYAVTITEMEKVVAYFKVYVVDAVLTEGYLQDGNRPDNFPDLPNG